MQYNLKKIDKKLDILEQDGVSELLFDLLDIAGVKGDKLYKAQIIRELKKQYWILKDALTPVLPKQQTLFND